MLHYSIGLPISLHQGAASGHKMASIASLLNSREGQCTQRYYKLSDITYYLLTIALRKEAGCDAILWAVFRRRIAQSISHSSFARIAWHV